MTVKTSLVLFILILQVSRLSAQDYIRTKDGEKISAKIISFDSSQIKYRYFASSDTLIYSLNREELEAIAFTRDNISRIEMPDAQHFISSDSEKLPSHIEIIFMEKGDLLRTSIDTFLDNQVQFHVLYLHDTSKYFLNKSEIKNITFTKIPKSAAQIISPEQYDKTPDKDIESRATADARANYHAYSAAGTVSLLSGLFVLGTWPVAIPLAMSVTSPERYNLGYPNGELMKNPSYSKAYTEEARRIKSRKVWNNFAIGAGISVGLVIIMFGSLFIR
ncbi:MAG: hypothetical protein ACHQK8_05295 [Bacteroidia bacterium]